MARRRQADVPSLTQERLHTALLYDAETGFFWWRNPTKRMNSTKPVGERHNLGYVVIRINDTRYYAHRLAWFYVHGQWPKAQIDHINGTRDDNRIANLREATNTENCRHGGRPIHNTSGLKGAVAWRGRWAGRIKFNGKLIHLGMFPTPEAAHQAYCEAAVRLHGTFWDPGARDSHNRETQSRTTKTIADLQKEPG